MLCPPISNPPSRALGLDFKVRDEVKSCFALIAFILGLPNPFSKSGFSPVPLGIPPLPDPEEPLADLL